MKRQHFCDRNELDLGPLAKVASALRRVPSSHLNHYLEGYHSSRLVPVLARRFGVPAGRIFLYYGLEDFLRMLFGGLRSGETVLTNELHYAFYDEIATLKGVRLATFKLQKGKEVFSFDIDDCLRKIKRLKPRVVLLTSPNNPTGHVLTPEEFRIIARAVPDTSLLLLDEAYIGFQRDYDEQSFLRIVRQIPNVALLRTFSKDFGLAGLRLGYILAGQSVPGILREAPRDLGLSRIHEELGLAAMASDADRRRAVEYVISIRDRFIRQINQLSKFRAYRSEGNFVLITAKTKSAMQRLDQRQLRLPVVIGKRYGQRYLRVSIGRAADVQRFVRLARRLDA